MSIGKAKHLYPGGNTALGFFSFYNNIIKQEEANKLIIIKGGPGVGKSTFMKKIGEEMLKKGYDVEFLHCSSDNNSLDGVKIPKLNIVFIDGTAPHIVDPKSPGAVDEILNFGDFWDEKGIRVYKEEIINTNKEIAALFERSYKYIKAAYAIYEDSLVINRTALNKGEANLFAFELVNEIFADADIAKEEGKERSMFVSAITPNGYCNYLDSLLEGNKVYELKGKLATNEEVILDKIKRAAIERGYFVEAFYCALNPYKIEHLIIPELKIALFTSNQYHTSTVSKSISIDMKQFYNQNILDYYKEDLNRNKKEFDKLMSIALQCINKAKTKHDQLETYYIPNINFDMINTCFDITIEGILSNQT